jgi:putative N6-adenine-specific DNA methylase
MAKPTLHKRRNPVKPLSGKEGDIEMVATCLFNLEDVLAEEIRQLGGKQIKKLRRAVSYQGDKKLLYKSNLWLRTALRVLRPIKSFFLKKEQDLYDVASKLPWESWFDADKTLWINESVNSELFKNSHFAALRLKDAIVDHFRSQQLPRPSVERQDPDVTIHLHIDRNRVNISLDSSGDPLFKRGYRAEHHLSPLNECLAAGMILLSGWKGQDHFLDPMCGSGTLAIEAAMIATQTPPNLYRKGFAFEKWKNYEAGIFEEVLAEGRMARKRPRIKIETWDNDRKSIAMARKNIHESHFTEDIELRQQDFFESKAPADHGYILLNPPYGERLQLPTSLSEFYGRIGSTFKHQFQGWEAWVISSEIAALKQLGLKPKKKIPLKNGKLDCQFRGYELFAGKRIDAIS